jgi:hypothetical protein
MHQHFWVAFMRFHVKPPFENSEDNPLVMDHENVMGGPLIACMACKKKYEAGLENTGCELDGS